VIGESSLSYQSRAERQKKGTDGIFLAGWEENASVPFFRQKNRSRTVAAVRVRGDRLFGEILRAGYQRLRPKPRRRRRKVRFRRALVDVQGRGPQVQVPFTAAMAFSPSHRFHFNEAKATWLNRYRDP